MSLYRERAMLTPMWEGMRTMPARAVVLLVTLFGLSGCYYYTPCPKSALSFNQRYSVGYLKSEDGYGETPVALNMVACGGSQGINEPATALEVLEAQSVLSKKHFSAHVDGAAEDPRDKFGAQADVAKLATVLLEGSMERAGREALLRAMRDPCWACPRRASGRKHLRRPPEWSMYGLWDRFCQLPDGAVRALEGLGRSDPKAQSR